MSKLLLGSAVPLLLILIAVPGVSYDASNRDALLLQAGPISKAPTIDGILNPGEWDEAAESNVFHLLGSGELVWPSPRMLIGFDKDNLYIAAAMPLPPGVKPKAVKRDWDGAVWTDDALEIMIDPQHDHASTYQMLVNAAGSMADTLNSDMSWNGKWQAAATHDKRFWYAEVEIPFATIGVTEIKSRTLMGLNIGWDRQVPQPQMSSWAIMPSRNFRVTTDYGHLILDPNGPSVSATMFLSRGSFGFDVGTIPARSALTGVFEVAKNGISLGKQTLPLSADTKLSLALPENYTDSPDTNYTWYCDIVQTETGNILQRQYGTLQAAKAAPVAIALRKYFIQGKLLVDVDTANLDLPDEPLTLVASISTRDGKPIAEKTVTVRGGIATSLAFDVSKLPPVFHVVAVRALDADGRQVGEGKGSFLKPPRPAWADTKVGITNKVLPPWTPLKTASANGKISVSPWGRTYTFGGTPFPSSMSTRGASILSGPIAMKAVVNGKAVAFKGQLKVAKKTDGKVILSGVALAGGLKAESQVTIDYDGNAWVNLKLRSGKQVTISRFSIEAPISKQYAKYRVYYPGSWGASDNARAIPAKGWSADYLPFVWIGDDDRGLALYSTSDQNWTAGAEKKAIEVVPSGANTMALRFNVISAPTTVTSKGLGYTFGFQATPVKKSDKEAWDYRFCEVPIFYGVEHKLVDPSATLRYPGRNAIDLRRGTAEMWVRVRFDPNAPIASSDPKSPSDRDLLIVSNPEESFKLGWSNEDHGMRYCMQKGAEKPLCKGAPCKWQTGELHHLSLTWGDELRLYVDGELLLTQPRTGLIGGEPSASKMEFPELSGAFDIDELRISDDEREPGIPGVPYTVDAHTLLLDHLDKMTKLRPGVWKTTPDRGPAGIARGSVALVQGHYGTAIAIDDKPKLVLDHLKEIGVRTIIFHEAWTEYTSYIETKDNQENLKSLVKACHQRSFQFLLYMGYLLPQPTPEWDPYHNEVLVMPIQGEYVRQVPFQKDYTVCYESPWQGCIADAIDSWMKKYDIDGVYLDGTEAPWACANTAHGCGYTKPDGTVGPTYAFAGARDMVRRIYAIVRSRKPDGQVNIHNSTVMTTPTFSWATSTWDGEQFGAIPRGANVDQLFPLDAFRAEFMGRQWGPPAELLCYGIPYTQHEAMSFSLLHDVPVRGDRQGQQEAAEMWSIMDEFGRKSAAFRPYWNNAALVKTLPDRTYSSLYVRPGKGIMCVVSNLGKEASDVSVSLNLKKMGLGANVTAVNAMTYDDVPINQGKFSIRLNSFDYALVWIKPQ